jgi:hypothetical protein
MFCAERGICFAKHETRNPRVQSPPNGQQRKCMRRSTAHASRCNERLVHGEVQRAFCRSLNKVCHRNSLATKPGVLFSEFWLVAPFRFCFVHYTLPSYQLYGDFVLCADLRESFPPSTDVYRSWLTDRITLPASHLAYYQQQSTILEVYGRALGQTIQMLTAKSNSHLHSVP